MTIKQEDSAVKVLTKRILEDRRKMKEGFVKTNLLTLVPMVLSGEVSPTRYPRYALKQVLDLVYVVYDDLMYDTRKNIKKALDPKRETELKQALTLSILLTVKKVPKLEVYELSKKEFCVEFVRPLLFTQIWREYNLVMSNALSGALIKLGSISEDDYNAIMKMIEVPDNHPISDKEWFDTLPKTPVKELIDNRPRVVTESHLSDFIKKDNSVDNEFVPSVLVLAYRNENPLKHMYKHCTLTKMVKSLLDGGTQPDRLYTQEQLSEISIIANHYVDRLLQQSRYAEGILMTDEDRKTLHEHVVLVLCLCVDNIRSLNQYNFSNEITELDKVVSTMLLCSGIWTEFYKLHGGDLLHKDIDRTNVSSEEFNKVMSMITVKVGNDVAE